ncbi:hypothetical protein DEO72_LG4g113 [Vigna unguiculata]|uniref:Uncharacterized protein n=1 Tax=Vigna unguiculata TaxID=3917 RepID=A0A4D6LMB3_VIGUN|nr:hypothetical protein DEO72_LG4g113 [Vigna unguiculata]
MKLVCQMYEFNAWSAKTHIVVPKPVASELLVWCLATDMLPSGDKPQTVGSLDEWHLVAGDYRQAVWRTFSPGGT